jgi:hypothetical protein
MFGWGCSEVPVGLHRLPGRRRMQWRLRDCRSALRLLPFLLPLSHEALEAVHRPLLQPCNEVSKFQKYSMQCSHEGCRVDATW